MGKPKVSIIVPIYGVEKYIERCARSLFEQTLDEVEYIFIDDCTPDLSIEVLKQALGDYPNRKSQVVFHRMEMNSGQAVVRKWGMTHATGEYIIHCDSDDWVDKNLYDSLYKKAIESKADIAICDFAISNGENERWVKGCFQDRKVSIMKDMCSMKISWSLCNKLVKSSLLQDEHFVYPKDNMGEDMALVTQFVSRASKVVHVSNAYYHYFDNPESITRKKDFRHIESIFFQVKNNTDIAIRALEDSGFITVLQAALCVMKLNVKKQLLPLVHNKHYYKLWRSTFSETDQQVWLNPYVSYKEKMKYLLILIRLYPTTKSRVMIQ